jgi:hypothetical protein
MADYGNGLVTIAEDGNPASLAAYLATNPSIFDSGAFDTPVGGGGPAPIFPGEAYEFSVMADPANPNLSFATMFVQSNDTFLAPEGMGISLFDGGGNPISGNVTEQVLLWDVGSELNEAPGMGPNQAPRQAGPNTGAAEGGVHQFTNSTRSLPIASGIATVEVMEDGGVFTITLENNSGNNGAIDTPIAPVFYATHDDTWQLFEVGMPDFGDGLETLAEDGSPADLVASYSGAPGTGIVGAEGAAGIGTGGMFQLTITPDMNHPYLTIAAMAVKSNDAFLAFWPQGVKLLDDGGLPRPVDEINGEIAAALTLWDAGTEANEVPGVGPNQPLNGGPAVGPADPDNSVRVYSDATNDLAGPFLGGFVDLMVTNQGGTTFAITLTNTSDTTAYPGILTPMAWALHDQTVSLFTEGMAASPGLESLAEDGDPANLIAELMATPGVDQSGVVGSGPILPGQRYTATVTVNANGRYLSIASMVVPSNDTFLAFEPMGLALLDETGTPRSDLVLAMEIEDMLAAWDAGTERNQAGAAGPDQAPQQSGPNTGADEGNGLVREVMTPDPVWSYPPLADILQVTITPQTPTDVSLSGISRNPNPYVSPVIWLLVAGGGLLFLVGLRKVVVKRQRISR